MFIKNIQKNQNHPLQFHEASDNGEDVLQYVLDDNDMYEGTRYSGIHDMYDKKG